MDQGERPLPALLEVGTSEPSADGCQQEREENASPAIFCPCLQPFTFGPVFVCVHPPDSVVLSLGLFLSRCFSCSSLLSLSLSLRLGESYSSPSHISCSTPGAFEDRNRLIQEAPHRPARPQSQTSQHPMSYPLLPPCLSMSPPAPLLRATLHHTQGAG